MEAFKEIDCVTAELSPSTSFDKNGSVRSFDAGTVGGWNSSPVCKHADNAVDLVHVRRKVKAKDFNKCKNCSLLAAKDPSYTIPKGLPIAVCLKCGHQGCYGSIGLNHARKHFEALKTGVHPVYLFLSSFQVWCFNCECALAPDASDLISDAVKYMRGIESKRTSSDLPKPEQLVLSYSEAEGCPGGQSPTSAPRRGGATEGVVSVNDFHCNNAVKPKGFFNLGNTCFFNSVLQVLVHTPALMSVLRRSVENHVIRIDPNSKLPLLKPALKLDDECYDEIEVSLPAGGTALRTAFLDFVSRMRTQEKPALSPSSVYDTVRERISLFRDSNQHDSHELLRCFVDALREEEIESVKTGLLLYFGLPKNCSGFGSMDKKHMAYLHSAQVPAVDQVFGGTLLQRIKCLSCGSVSFRLDPFLDLSLCLRTARQTQIVIKQPVQKLSKKAQRKSKKRQRQQRKMNGLANGECKQQWDNETSTNVTNCKEKLDAVGSATVERCTAELKQLTVSNSELEETSESSGNDFCITLQSTYANCKVSDEDDETIEDCLHSFFAEELMEGSGQFACEDCAKAAAGSSHSNQKSATVLSDAVRRVVIFSPPAVLTLHLKRFAQSGSTIRKISEDVTFSRFLDLSPFCSKRSRGITSGQVLYELYGVICHFGSANEGHYIAYVRTRNEEQDRKFLQLVSLVENVTFVAQYEGNRQRDQQVPSVNKAREGVHCISQNGKEGGSWYRLSDKVVTPVLESEVLKSTAYLLFYERTQ